MQVSIHDVDTVNITMSIYNDASHYDKFLRKFAVVEIETRDSERNKNQVKLFIVESKIDYMIEAMSIKPEQISEYDSEHNLIEKAVLA